MRIFTIKEFHKWARNNELTDDLLRKAVVEIEQGLIDADLGSNLLKKRVATKGRGKSGSVRTLLAYSTGKRTIFMYGFEKSDRSNISAKEKKALQELGKFYLTLSDRELEPRLASRAIVEIRKEK
jgi:hypothetical protein